jgi:hypothetical protein
MDGSSCVFHALHLGFFWHSAQHSATEVTRVELRFEPRSKLMPLTDAHVVALVGGVSAVSGCAAAAASSPPQIWYSF